MDYLKDLFGYNAGFVDEIIRSLRAIDPTRLVDEKISAWVSLRNLVMRLIEVRDYWINKILQNKEFRSYDFEEFSSVDLIEKRWKEVEADIGLFLNSLNPDDLMNVKTVNWDKEYSFPIEKILRHLYTHTVHTRGQIVAAIRILAGVCLMSILSKRVGL